MAVWAVGLRMPLGRPVVPPEYTISRPSPSSAIGAVGNSAEAAATDSNPAASPVPVVSLTGTRTRSRSITTGAVRAEATTAVAPQSSSTA